MALIHLDFESEFMGSNQDVNIIVPDKPRNKTPKQFYRSDKKFKVLWLLHGTFGGYSDWIRKSNIELYACEKDLIVVMPGVGNSDYEAWDNFTLGYDAERYLVDELMPLVYNWLPASDKRADNFIAGLSMGGAGALKFALKYPRKFCRCASLSFVPWNYDAQREEMEELFAKKRSEVMDPKDVMHMNLRRYNQMHRYDSVDEYLASYSNLYRKLEEAADKKGMPKFFFSTGTEDPLMAENFKAIRTHLSDLGFEAVWVEGPGSHEWRVWERDIQMAFDFFGLNGKDKGNAF